MHYWSPTHNITFRWIHIVYIVYYSEYFDHGRGLSQKYQCDDKWCINVLQDTFSDLLQYYNILNLWLYISNVYYIALDPNLLNYYVSTVCNIHFTNHRNPNKRFPAQLLIIYLYIMKSPQAVINFILESFPYLVTPKICSYHNYSISYGTLNMVWSSQTYQCHDNSS
jgi:hypothetical protein